MACQKKIRGGEENGVMKAAVTLCRKRGAGGRGEKLPLKFPRFFGGRKAAKPKDAKERVFFEQKRFNEVM